MILIEIKNSLGQEALHLFKDYCSWGEDVVKDVSIAGSPDMVDDSCHQCVGYKTMTAGAFDPL